jgi:hypothetical protein
MDIFAASNFISKNKRDIGYNSRWTKNNELFRTKTAAIISDRQNSPKQLVLLTKIFVSFEKEEWNFILTNWALLACVFLIIILLFPPLVWVSYMFYTFLFGVFNKNISHIISMLLSSFSPLIVGIAMYYFFKKNCLSGSRKIDWNSIAFKRYLEHYAIPVFILVFALLIVPALLWMMNTFPDYISDVIFIVYMTVGVLLILATVFFSIVDLVKAYTNKKS